MCKGFGVTSAGWKSAPSEYQELPDDLMQVVESGTVIDILTVSENSLFLFVFYFVLLLLFSLVFGFQCKVSKNTKDKCRSQVLTEKMINSRFSL